jgi:hypothetical protein
MAGNAIAQAIQFAVDRGCIIEFHRLGLRSRGVKFTCEPGEDGGIDLHVNYNSVRMRREFERHRLATMADPDGHIAQQIISLARELTTVPLRQAPAVIAKGAARS